MSSDKKIFDKITGRYLLIGNPCTTVPCLPGMAYAVLANNEYYYITINGHWFSENRSWNGYTPELGDVVTVTGSLGEIRDAFAKTLRTIEVVALERA